MDMRRAGRIRCLMLTPDVGSHRRVRSRLMQMCYFVRVGEVVANPRFAVMLAVLGFD